MAKLFPVARLSGVDRNSALATMAHSSTRVWEIINGNYMKPCHHCDGGTITKVCSKCHNEHIKPCYDCNGFGVVGLTKQRHDPEGGWRNCIVCGKGIMVDGPLCDVCEYWWSELKGYASDETIAVVEDAIRTVLEDEQ